MTNDNGELKACPLPSCNGEAEIIGGKLSDCWELQIQCKKCGLGTRTEKSETMRPETLIKEWNNRPASRDDGLLELLKTLSRNYEDGSIYADAGTMLMLDSYITAQPQASGSGEAVAWMRYLDDTDSAHVCAKGDPGSFPVYAAKPMESGGGDKYIALYHAANKLLYKMGEDGTVNQEMDVVLDLMDALREVDGGVYDDKKGEPAKPKVEDGDLLSQRNELKNLISDLFIHFNADHLDSVSGSDIGSRLLAAIGRRQ